MQRDANRFANYLHDHGIGQGSRVAVNGAQKAAVVAAHFGAWKVGAATVPTSLLFGPDGLRYRLADSESSAFVADGSTMDTVREVQADLDHLQQVLTVDPQTRDDVDFWEAIDDYSVEFDTVNTDAVDDAQIIYTSGTTGDPKGVRHPHHHFLGVLPLYVMNHRNMDIREEDVLRIPAEWAWAGSLNDVIMPSFFYGNPVVAYQSQGFEPKKEFELVDTYDITGYIFVATACRMMMQVDRPDERWDLDSLRTAIMGREAIGESLIEWVRDTFDDPAIHAGYGQTESPNILGHCEALDVSVKPGDNPLGVPAPGFEAKVVDPETDEEITEPGAVGELAIRYDGNPSCLKEYWNKPEKTRQKIRDGWMYTEDLVSSDEDGYLRFHSRDDDVILTSGYRVGPEEIEESLAKHDAVVDAGVIGVPHDQRGEVPKAFVVLTPEYEPSDDLRSALQTHVKELLAKYEYPREIEFIEDLPTTSTGKLRRVDLREMEGIA
jgi:acetyl-CoA synthetase